MATDVPLLERASRPMAPVPGVAVDAPNTRDPSLLTTDKPLEYVDIFVEDFESLGQEPNTRRICKRFTPLNRPCLLAIEGWRLPTPLQSSLPKEAVQR